VLDFSILSRCIIGGLVEVEDVVLVFKRWGRGVRSAGGKAIDENPDGRKPR